MTPKPALSSSEHENQTWVDLPCEGGISHSWTSQETSIGGRGIGEEEEANSASPEGASLSSTSTRASRSP